LSKLLLVGYWWLRYLDRTKEKSYEGLKRYRLMPELGGRRPVGPEISPLSLPWCFFDHFSFTLYKICDPRERSLRRRRLRTSRGSGVRSRIYANCVKWQKLSDKDGWICNVVAKKTVISALSESADQSAISKRHSGSHPDHDLYRFTLVHTLKL